MIATITHRDREARHGQHYKIDCITSAPAAVKAKSRRSMRHAAAATLRDLLDEALAERAGLIS